MENEKPKFKTWSEEELVELKAKLIDSTKESFMCTNRNKRYYDPEVLEKAAEDFVNRSESGVNSTVYNDDNEPVGEVTLYPRITEGKDGTKFVTADVELSEENKKILQELVEELNMCQVRKYDFSRELSDKDKENYIQKCKEELERFKKAYKGEIIPMGDSYVKVDDLEYESMSFEDSDKILSGKIVAKKSFPRVFDLKIE